MKSTVTKAAWCTMILFIIPTQTSNSINEAKKPTKHNETLDENPQMSRDRTSVESQTLNQTPANFTIDEPNTEQCSVERQDNEPCSKASISDTYTEEQFFRRLSESIVEWANGCKYCEDKLNNNDKCCKIYEGEQQIFEGIELTVIYVHLQSYIFKLNYNDKDFIMKYLRFIPCCEDKIIVKAKHENIVEVYYSFYTEDEKGFSIVMEAMDCDLTQYAKKHPDRLKDVVKSVVNALQYLHSNGIAHCDLKLSNILVKTVEGKTVYKLCDFGSAMFIEKDDEVEPDDYLFTEVYQAPEMIYEGYITQKADIWMLGHTIWYYIDSANAEQFFEDEKFDSDKYEEYLESPEDCPLRKNRLDIINNCCTKDPEDRASFETILQWCNESD